VRDAAGQHVDGLEGPILLELKFPSALRGGIRPACFLDGRFHGIFSDEKLWCKNRAVAKNKFPE
jgi:hypothetical protein